MERRVGECYQWRAIGQYSKGGSCSFSHHGASENGCDERQKKDNRLLLHQKRKHRLTERYPQKVQVAEGKVLEQEAGFRSEITSGESVRALHVIFGTLPCVSITSLNQDALMAKSADSDTLRLMDSPAKSRRKVV